MSTDSTIETKAHIKRVQDMLDIITTRLSLRWVHHDDSKLVDPEKSVFDVVTEKLKGMTYGSEEYKASLAEMKPALDHHYANNRHHPEHTKLWKCPLCAGVFTEDQAPEAVVYDSKPRFCPDCCPQGSLFEATLEPHVGLEGMTLVDLVEMFCDWCAATERHADGDIMKSIEHNAGRFGYGDVLKAIFRNTAEEYGMGKRSS